MSTTTDIKHFSEDPELAQKIMGFSFPAEWAAGDSSLEEALETTRRFWMDDDAGSMPKGFVDALNRSLTELVQAGLDTQSIQVGEAFPEFELPDHNGNSVRSSELLKDGPLVVTFYRGGWCPYCNLALKALQSRLPEMKELGANLVAISPQLPDGSLSTAEQNKLEFSVLSDVGLDVTRQAGVIWEIPDYAMAWHQKFFGMNLEANNGSGNSDELPVPATFVIGRDGRVLWRFVEAKYWERANPDDIVNALRSQA